MTAQTESKNLVGQEFVITCGMLRCGSLQTTTSAPIVR